MKLLAKGKIDVSEQMMIALIPLILSVLIAGMMNFLLLFVLQSSIIVGFYLIFHLLIFLLVLIPCARIGNTKNGLKIVGIYVLVILLFASVYSFFIQDSTSYGPTILGIIIIPPLFSIMTARKIGSWSKQWNKQFETKI